MCYPSRSHAARPKNLEAQKYQSQTLVAAEDEPDLAGHLVVLYWLPQHVLGHCGSHLSAALC